MAPTFRKSARAVHIHWASPRQEMKGNLRFVFCLPCHTHLEVVDFNFSSPPVSESWVHGDMSCWTSQVIRNPKATLSLGVWSCAGRSTQQLPPQMCKTANKLLSTPPPPRKDKTLKIEVFNRDWWPSQAKKNKGKKKRVVENQSGMLDFRLSGRTGQYCYLPYLSHMVSFVQPHS